MSRLRPTLAQLREPIPATCGRCGGQAEIRPDPMPRGTFVCLNDCTGLRGALKQARRQL